MKIIPYADLQSRKQSEVAKDLKVTPEELKTFLTRVVITSSEGRLKFGIWNKFRKKKKK